MRTVFYRGDYYRLYDKAEPWMTERWVRWLESDIHREWRFVRWGIETREGDLTWQILALAMLLPWFFIGIAT